ncbi:MAG: 4Fe-4S binding protein [Thermodesulfobacteriota bacterium]|nr:4Fe-4S binding protein [Thermodesulfobacteriota bacterium]
MKWTSQAEAAVKKVPFFVRKKVRARIEREAAQAGKKTVSLADVKATQARFLSNISSEIKGYQLDTCFGASGCPNRANKGDKLLKRIEALVKEEDLLGFLKQQVKGDLKFHHEFRITLADCPNACSQPQIKDIGIIGASQPVLTDEACTLCEACVDACRENAITLQKENNRPDIDDDRCLACGKCMEACPTGTISTGKIGFKVQLGGKLGRHPQLAKQLPGIYSEDEVLDIIKNCIIFYKGHSKQGQRFAEIFSSSDFENFSKRYGT